MAGAAACIQQRFSRARSDTRSAEQACNQSSKCDRKMNYQALKKLGLLGRRGINFPEEKKIVLFIKREQDTGRRPVRVQQHGLHGYYQFKRNMFEHGRVVAGFVVRAVFRKRIFIIQHYFGHIFSERIYFVEVTDTVFVIDKIQLVKISCVHTQVKYLYRYKQQYKARQICADIAQEVSKWSSKLRQQ